MKVDTKCKTNASVVISLSPFIHVQHLNGCGRMSSVADWEEETAVAKYGGKDTVHNGPCGP
jgi:hypothetical protein